MKARFKQSQPKSASLSVAEQKSTIQVITPPRFGQSSLSPPPPKSQMESAWKGLTVGSKQLCEWMPRANVANLVSSSEQYIMKQQHHVKSKCLAFPPLLKTKKGKKCKIIFLLLSPPSPPSFGLSTGRLVPGSEWCSSEGGTAFYDIALVSVGGRTSMLTGLSLHCHCILRIELGLSLLFLITGLDTEQFSQRYFCITYKASFL